MWAVQDGGCGTRERRALGLRGTMGKTEGGWRRGGHVVRRVPRLPLPSPPHWFIAVALLWAGVQASGREG